MQQSLYDIANDTNVNYIRYSRSPPLTPMVLKLIIPTQTCAELGMTFSTFLHL